MTNKKRILVFLLIIISVFAGPSQKVFAVNDFYSGNDILFFDGEAACYPTTPNTSTVDTSANLETTLKYLTGKGLSLAAASGIAGNLSAESSIMPNRIQNKIDDAILLAPDNYTIVDNVGFGIAQWTSVGRQKALADFAKSQGKNITDLNMQLDFMWQELNVGYETVLKDVNSIKSTSIFGSTTAPMASAIVFHGKTDKIANSPSQEINDVANSSIGFKSGFEGSNDTTVALIDNRGKKAESIFNTYKSTISDGTGVVGIGDEVAGSINGNNGCFTAAGDATWPENVESHNKGWAVKDGVDYRNVPCANGSIDTNNIYEHPIRKFRVRMCSTGVGQVSSLISQKVITMINAAAQNGITLTGGAWRSYETQISLRISNCGGDIYTLPASSCNPPTATPGNSQHESGLAIDFNGIDKIGSGPEWDWLVANAVNFGFYNLPSEGWHWSMSGS